MTVTRKMRIPEDVGAGDLGHRVRHPPWLEQNSELNIKLSSYVTSKKNHEVKVSRIPRPQ